MMSAEIYGTPATTAKAAATAATATTTKIEDFV
jgi:hypothetical protein